MPHPLGAGTIRILKPDGSTAGTGFLVSKGLAVTCAHVVESAGEIIQTQFVGRDEIVSAQLIPEYYRDPDNGDIAFLRLESTPENIKPLRLGAAEQSPAGNPFQALGYPSVGEIEGVHARGEILGRVTEKGQQIVQLRSTELNQGHSGAPIWDEKRGVVVGMVVSIYRSDESGKLRDTAFAIPSETLWQVCPEIQPSEAAPYLGLESFNDGTAQFFFGREAFTEKLLNVLRGGNRFLAVFGPSGSGKSSVVRAGLLPALKKGQLPGSQKWAQITMRPADNPFEQMKTAGLDPIDLSGYLKSHADTERVVLFIDQFEELFALSSEEVRIRFVHDLANALENSMLILVLSMRDDFYSAFNAKAAPLAESEDLKIENVPRGLKRDELVEMIERPAATIGLALEEGLTELIIRDLTHDGDARSSTLPLMEFTLTQLWEKRRDGQLRHDAYQTIGGVTGSLARWADDAYSALPKADQQVAESLLISLVHLGDEAQGLPDTRRRLTLTDIDESTQGVIKHFSDRRLLVTGGHTVELVHDALLREWARLRNWLEQDRENLKIRDGIIEAARQWETSGRDESLLNHRAGRLEDAVALGKVSRYGLASTEKAYLDACVKFREREKNARGKMQRRIVIGLTCFSITVVALLIYSLVQQHQSRAFQLGYRAEAELAEGFYNSAALHAYQSNQLYTNDQANNVLRKLPYENFELGKALVGHTDRVTSVAWSADGRLASGSWDNTVIIWDPVTSTPKQTLKGHKGDVTSLAWSADGRLASAGDDNAIIIWDLATGKPAQILKRKKHPSSLDLLPSVASANGFSSIVWSPDGLRLASGSYDNTVIIWDLTTGKPVQTFQGDTTGIAGPGAFVAWSQDGRLASSGSENGNIIIWNLATGQPAQTFKGSYIGVLGIAWSIDGRLASVDFRNVILWNLATGTPDQILASNFSPTSVAWSPNGRLATGSTEGRVILWDLTTSQPEQKILQGDYAGIVEAVAWSPDGRLASTTEYDNTVMLWNFVKYQPAQTLEGHTGAVTSLGWSADGRLASGAKDDTVIIWNVTLGLPDQILKGHKDIIQSVAWSTDGRLASASSDGIILWNLATGQPAMTLKLTKQNTDNITTLAWSPDGQLTSGSSDNTIILWNLATGRPAQILKGHKDSVTSVAWSPGGQLASGSSDKTVVIWNLSTGRPAKILTGHTEGVTSVAWSPDGRLASADSKGIIIWDLATAQPAQNLEISSSSDQYPPALAWWADGQLATTSSGINIWDLKTGEVFAPLGGRSSSVIAWSPAGSLTSASDSIIKITRSDIIRARPCDWIYGNMSVSEWSLIEGASYIYQPACPNLPVPRFSFFSALITWRGRFALLVILLVLFTTIGLIFRALYRRTSRLWHKIYDRFGKKLGTG